MKNQTVLIENEKEGTFILYKKVDLTPFVRLNQEEKKLIGKGFSKRKTC